MKSISLLLLLVFLPFYGFAGREISKGFARPSLLYVSGFTKVYLAEFYDPFGKYGNAITRTVKTAMAASIRTDGKFELIEDVAKAGLNLTDLESFVQSKDSVVEAGFNEIQSILICGSVLSNTIRQEYKTEKIETKEKCKEFSQYILSGSIRFKIRFFDLGSNKLLGDDVMDMVIYEEGPKEYCSEARRMDEEYIIKDRILARNQRFSRMICSYKEYRTFELKDDFLADPFPKLGEGLSNLEFQNYSLALGLFKKYSDSEKYGDRVKAKAFYNYSIALLIADKSDSSLLEIEKAIALKPKESDYSRLKEIIISELAIKKKIEEQNAKWAMAKKEFAGDFGRSKINDKKIIGEVDQKSLPNIFAVLIGVGEYKDPKISKLSFTENDCRSYFDFLKSPFGGAVKNENIKLLVGKQATRSNIIKALNEIFLRALESDLILLFIASHGQTDASGTELFFLPYDTDSENLEGTAVSQLEIQKITGKSLAGKKLIVADACHSGGLGTSIAKRSTGSTQIVTRLLSQLGANDNATVIFTASSGYETSQETPDLGKGHGVFTYFLLEGLKGAADKNQNGIVTIREVEEYVRRKVVDYTGGGQHPELKGYFKNNFPLSVYKLNE
jgi:hypothetical protein